MRNEVTGWFEDAEAMHHAARAEQSEHAVALSGAVENRLATVREENETQPQIDDRDWTNDIRYKTGFAAALSWFLNQPAEARELVAEGVD